MCQNCKTAEFIGALANMGYDAPTAKDIMEVFKRIGLENSKGDSYVTEKGIKCLVKKAKTYWEEKERPMIVEKINTYFVNLS